MGRPSNIVVVNADYRKLAESFYQYQKRLGYVPNSYQAKFNYLNEFLHWLECKGNTDVLNVTTAEIKDYYNYVSIRPSKKDGGALSPKTTHSHMRIVRDFFEMLLQENKITINPTATLKFYYPQSSEERNTITQLEVQQLYEDRKSVV